MGVIGLLSNDDDVQDESGEDGGIWPITSSLLGGSLP
jgi:hypothetical protein